MAQQLTFVVMGPAQGRDDVNGVASRFNVQTAKKTPNATPHSRGAMRARVVHESRAQQEGVGNAGRTVHPQPRVQRWKAESTRVVTVAPESPGIPARNGFTAYIVLSPVTGFLATVAGGKIPPT
jgi:hypothetical protein